MPSPPVQPGLRRLKKGDNKDKLKNRMSMAFRKPFQSKDKNKSPDPTSFTPPQPGPPAYSAAPPSAQANRPATASVTIDPSRRSSTGSRSGCGRSNKPTPQPSEGLVSRRSHVGSGAVGTSPPLPPLPRNGSMEGPGAPRVTALLGGNLHLQADELLPRNSFGPAFEVPVIEGLGIGLEKAPQRGKASSPPPALPQASPPQRARSPPQTLVQQPQIRLHSPPPQVQQQPVFQPYHQQSPPAQQPLHHHRSAHDLHYAAEPTFAHELHHQYSQPQLRAQSPPEQHLHQGPPPLARPVTAPEEPVGNYVNRRMSMIAQGGDQSAASKRLSMMRRGPPVFGSSSANSSTSTLETAAATAAQAEKRLSPELAAEMQQQPKQLLDEDEVGELSAASRDRIAKLRGRASISAAVPTAPQVNVMRGANRKDPTKAYTLASAPQGFDISLIKSKKSTFSPLKALPAPSSSIVRSSPLATVAPVKAATPPLATPLPAAPDKDLSLYVLRPTVSKGTQTPNWDALASSSSRTARRGSRQVASTPPLAYSSFPGPAPPPPPHDSPPQQYRPNISPSIYSVASFDTRARNARGSRGGRSSFYANGEVPEEFGEYGYHRDDAPPLPREMAHNIERHSQAFGHGEANGYGHGYVGEEVGELEQEEAAPVNYDVPYLSSGDFATPHLRPFDIPATPVPVNVPNGTNGPCPAPSALTAAGALTPVVEDATPLPTPTPYTASTFDTSSPFYSSAAPTQGALEILESPRTNSRTPFTANGISSVVDNVDAAAAAEAEDAAFAPRPRTPSYDSSIDSHIRSTSSRRSSEDPMTTPPTSAVSSTFPSRIHETQSDKADKPGETAISDGEIDPDTPVVMIRKASIVTSQVRKASLVSVTPPSSRPQSVVVGRKGSSASLSGIGVDTRRFSHASSTNSDGSSPRQGERSPRIQHFQLDLPGQGEIPPIPAVPSPIRREFGDAAFALPAGLSKVSSAEAPVVESPESNEKEEEDESPSASPADALPAIPRSVSPAPSTAPHAPSLLAAVDFSSPRPASAPPEESSSLPLRRQSESDKPLVRSRTPMMSREERAAKGRSYFLVQALMGEVQPEGMIRDWAKQEGEESDDDVSLLAGESSSEDELSDFEEEQQ
ncbi:hypothetical protein JCM11251_005916 [Rhodosporidiobolus azoricus]